jgi:hypothetical protein
MARSGRVELRVITPDATPEEVAAITAAVAASVVRPVAVVDAPAVAEVSNWVLAPRLSGRRAGYARGEWRLSGRMGRRSRA